MEETGKNRAGSAVGSDNGEVAAAAEGEGSILSTLRRKRQEIRRDKTTTLEVSGYDGFLLVKYKPIDYNEFSKLVRKLQKAKNTDAEVGVAADILVRTCVGFYYRDELDGRKVKPLHESDAQFGDEPIVYDERLAKVVGLTVDNRHVGRSIAIGLFNNELALVDHSNEVVEWMRSNDAEENEGFPTS